VLTRSPRWLAQRGCCSSPQPQVTRAFQTADSSHRLHLTVFRAMGQCAGVVTRGPALAPVTAHRLALPSAPWSVPAAGGPTVAACEGSKTTDKTGVTR
jgi:hypothetical protein